MTKNELEKQAKELLGKFYYHYVFDEDSGRINAHTHGLEEHFYHMDLQIVLPVSKEVAGGIFLEIVMLIHQGKVFESGKRYSDILQVDNQIELMEAKETGRDVLRILLPDPKRKLPSDADCDPVYRRQLIH